MISEDHVTLKSNDAENTAVQPQSISYTLLYIHIQNSYLKF